MSQSDWDGHPSSSSRCTEIESLRDNLDGHIENKKRGQIQLAPLLV